MGAAESAPVTMDLALRWLAAWKRVSRSQQLLCPSSSAWRTMFSECTDAVGLSTFSFRPYSLRRGGATYWFGKHGSLDRVVVLGRWQAQRAARIYINEGMASIAEMSLPKTSLKPYLTIFKAGSHKPRFT